MTVNRLKDAENSANRNPLGQLMHLGPEDGRAHGEASRHGAQPLVLTTHPLPGLLGECERLGGLAPLHHLLLDALPEATTGLEAEERASRT